MPALDFPNSPSINDTFTSGVRTWQWDGSTWNLVSGSQTLANKGDLLTKSATAVVRQAVGTDNHVLTADSSATNGIAWKQPEVTKGRAIGFALIFG